MCIRDSPGTGAAIIGSIWPLIIAFFSAIAAFFIKVFWSPIKKALSKVFRRKNKKQEKEKQSK